MVSVSKSIDDVEIISEEVEEEEIELEVQIEPLIEQKDEQIVLELDTEQLIDESELTGKQLRAKRRMNRKISKELSELPPLEIYPP